jgi:hypothetical protein
VQSRRSFFARFATAIAIVALAPEIAFQRKLEVKSPMKLPKWVFMTGPRNSGKTGAIDIFTDRETANMINSAIYSYYEGRWKYAG